MVYGVPHHAVIRDYTQIVSNDDPDVVKGRAGSCLMRLKITTMKS
jgi:hypothetical protein